MSNNRYNFRVALPRCNKLILYCVYKMRNFIRFVYMLLCVMSTQRWRNIQINIHYSQRRFTKSKKMELLFELINSAGILIQFVLIWLQDMLIARFSFVLSKWCRVRHETEQAVTCSGKIFDFTYLCLELSAFVSSWKVITPILSATL